MKFLHTMIRVADLEKSIEFYTKVLGMKELERHVNNDYRYTLVFVGYEQGGTTIELTHNWDTNEYEMGNAFGHLALGVGDIYAACDQIKSLGGNGTDEPGLVDVVEPREMTREDIKQVVEQYRQAALNAIDAGFDGIELHAANGYLINQFIDSEANNRTDEYGGSIENRLRFLGEVVEAMVEAIGAERVGVRLAPFTSLNGTVDATPVETYTAAAALLNLYKIVYLHIAEVDWDDAPETPKAFKAAVREAYDGVLIYAGKYDSERGEKAVAEGVTDMVGFGRPFVANPDLPARIQNGYPLAAHDPNTLFGGAEKGLTDYPAYAG